MSVITTKVSVPGTVLKAVFITSVTANQKPLFTCVWSEENELEQDTMLNFDVSCFL